MKKTAMIAVVIGVLMAGGVGSWRGGQTAQNTENPVDSIVSDITAQASEEFKRALVNEVKAFFKSDDLSKTLGIDSDGQAKLEESIRSYVDHYSMDAEKLSEAKESLNTLLQNAEGLSAEEIQKKIEGIFEE